MSELAVFCAAAHKDLGRKSKGEEGIVRRTGRDRVLWLTIGGEKIGCKRGIVSSKCEQSRKKAAYVGEVKSWPYFIRQLHVL